MKRQSALYLVGSVLTALLLLTRGPAHAQEVRTSTVTIPPNGHPVAMALEQLETIFNLPLDYEDPPYVREGATWPTTPTGQPLNMRPQGPISFTYEAPAPDADLGERKALAAKAITAVLQSFNSMRLSQGWFAVVPTKDGFDVIPTQRIDTSGRTQPFQSVMDLRISIPEGEVTYAQFVREVTNALSAATGRKIVPGAAPMPFFGQYKTKISATNEPARSLLARFIKDIPVGYSSEDYASARAGHQFHPIPTTLSWGLYCQVPDQILECALNFGVVAPENRSPLSMAPPLPPIPVQPTKQ